MGRRKKADIITNELREIWRRALSHPEIIYNEKQHRKIQATMNAVKRLCEGGPRKSIRLGPPLFDDILDDEEMLLLDTNYMLFFRRREDRIMVNIECTSGRPTREGLVFWWPVVDAWQELVNRWQPPRLPETIGRDIALETFAALYTGQLNPQLQAAQELVDHLLRSYQKNGVSYNGIACRLNKLVGMSMIRYKYAQQRVEKYMESRQGDDDPNLSHELMSGLFRDIAIRQIPKILGSATNSVTRDQVRERCRTLQTHQ